MSETKRPSRLAVIASVVFVVAAAALLYFLLQQPERQGPVLVIHGGAGKVERGEGEAPRREALREALRRGYAVLERGGTSLDAVETAVAFLEDRPEFNAGHGAVFNFDGENEMDAAIMDGRTLHAGAVASVHHIRNPVRAARLVMEKSKHVMMIGAGADRFAEEQGLVPVPRNYFHTEYRWKKFLEAREEEGLPWQGPDPFAPPAEESRGAEEGGEPAETGEEIAPEAGPEAAPGESEPSAAPEAPLPVPVGPDADTPPADESADEEKHGTVGAVALDKYGNLAAATSTGGLTLKRYGRVGDTPIIGAGTYADNRSCAVSATGTGEFFIRGTVARDICALVEMRGTGLRRAARRIIHGKLAGMGGDGGIIAVDGHGNFTFAFNTEAMMRGVKTPRTEEVAIFREEAEAKAE